MRNRLAHQYIRGRGIEIGALHNPTPVPHGARVIYVDRCPPEEAHPDVRHLVQIKDVVIDDAERLINFPESELDFIIANHVLEHCHDPIGTLKRWASVLCPGGIIFAAVPEKTHTFDRDRQVTLLSHLKQDHFDATTVHTQHKTNDEHHYREWLYTIDKLRGDALEAAIAKCVKDRANIHFHVWDIPAQKELIGYIETAAPLQFVELGMNGAELIWILRKK